MCIVRVHTRLQWRINYASRSCVRHSTVTSRRMYNNILSILIPNDLNIRLTCKRVWYKTVVQTLISILWTLVGVFAVDKVFAGYPAVITEHHSNIARVFCSSEIRFSDRLRSVRRLRFHVHCFFIYSRKSAHITLLYFRSDLYACRRISLIGAVNYFYEQRKQKNYNNWKPIGWLPFELQRAHTKYTPIITLCI